MCVLNLFYFPSLFFMFIRRQHLRSISDRALQMLPISEKRGIALPEPGGGGGDGGDIINNHQLDVEVPKEKEDTFNHALENEPSFRNDQLSYQLKNTKNLAIMLKHDLKEGQPLDMSEMLSKMSDPPAMEDIIKYMDTFIKTMHNRFLELKDASKYEIYEAYRVCNFFFSFSCLLFYFSLIFLFRFFNFNFFYFFSFFLCMIGIS